MEHDGQRGLDQRYDRALVRLAAGSSNCLVAGLHGHKQSALGVRPAGCGNDRKVRCTGGTRGNRRNGQVNYLLWSSIPDDELRTLADLGQLRDTAVMHAQIKRMLADPKSKRLVEAFGGQWLQTRNLDTVKPDARKFPEYDEDLRDAMQTETEMFLQAIVDEDRACST
jgi:hypothetical protein